MESSRTRKDSPAVKVYCLPDERAQLQADAADLIRVSGDLGRLAGLFKLWLTNEERTAMVGESKLRAVLEKIEATREELRAVIRDLVVFRAGRQEL
jgi:hypothetical protein